MTQTPDEYQPTTPYPAFMQQPAPQAPQPQRSRNGGLVAGIAIGAIIGGLVGGGAAAVIATNVGETSLVQAAGGTLTLSNVDSATAISGVAAVATPSVVTLQVSSAAGSGSGSGVIFTEDGYIITNAHVATLSGATAEPEISVRLSDGTRLDAVLVGSDPYADIAVVKVEAEGLTPIAIADSDAINVGDLAVAIGAPLNLSNTVTSGVVSALNRGISIASSMVPEGADDEIAEEDPNGSNQFPWDFRFETPEDQGQRQMGASSSVAVPVLQTDASINPGNSGGALLNSQAELIGINVALASNDNSETAGSDGLGFAIPSNLAVRVAEAIVAGEQPSHGLLGVSVVAASQDTDEDAQREGGLIAEVVPGGAAEQAGLRAGDVITAVDGVTVDSSTAVSAMIRYHAGGSDVIITYSRGGESSDVEVTLGTLEW
ncbi:S1C family serine protease [Leucobacter sp. W1478]|uniref:S1C family serine protease n=1 Tax=Leucobacter sp. W1478 TaxID=3439065 RepID=UPI003F3600E3